MKLDVYLIYHIHIFVQIQMVEVGYDSYCYFRFENNINSLYSIKRILIGASVLNCSGLN